MDTARRRRRRALVLGARTLAVLLVTEVVSATAPGAAMSPVDPVIDPEVRELVAAGRARVVVVLQVGETSDLEQRAEAISRAQDGVLSRLPRDHAALVRRYTSVPMLALEIDETGLRALEALADAVLSVKPDLPRRPQ